jgi:hypothetical protein
VLVAERFFGRDGLLEVVRLGIINPAKYALPAVALARADSDHIEA